jgi:hypothetical protein
MGSAPRACIKLSNQNLFNVEAQNPESQKSEIEKFSAGAGLVIKIHICLPQVKFQIKHHMWGVKNAPGCPWLKRVF